MANACAKLTSVASSVRQLRIDGFSLASSTMESQEYIKSRCDVDGHEWEVRCYPATSSFGKWVDLKLVLLSEALPPSSIVRASLACRLLHPIPQGRNISPPQEHRVSNAFKRPKDCSSRVSLVDRSYLAVPASPADDYLTVQCTVTVLKELSSDDAAMASPVQVPASDMHRHLAELLRTGTGADVTFLVSGESEAHKNILAARSPVFMAEFFGDMKEARSRRVEIKDMEAAAFRAILHFIYTDGVPELDQELAAVATMARHLLAAADRYGLDRLKLICEGKLAGGVTVDTAAATLALAEQHNCLQLKAKCVEFIVSSPAILDAVLATEGYRHLEASCPSVLTGLLKSVRDMKN